MKIQYPTEFVTQDVVLLKGQAYAVSKICDLIKSDPEMMKVFASIRSGKTTTLAAVEQVFKDHVPFNDRFDYSGEVPEIA